MRGRRVRIRKAQQHRLHEGAIRGGSGRSVATVHDRLVERTDDDFAAGGDEFAHPAQYFALLLAADQCPHGDALGARVADHDARGDSLRRGADHIVDQFGRDDGAPDARALLPGLDGHFGDERLHERLEFRGGGVGIRAEDGGVE